MLTTARPIIESVSASFLDPVSLADQQAQGVVSLIVVRYDPEAGQEGPGTDPYGTLGPTYDTFVAASGQLLAVARTTTDYRFPVMPATALGRFIEHRDAGRPAFLSVYELDEQDCARFLETVFYSECLKLHVDGAESAALVAHQIARSGCGNGILEVNDFSDPLAPRIRLLDLDGLAVSIGTVPPPDERDADEDPAIETGTVDPGGLTAVLAGHLDGVQGRVLLYDRAKNKAAMPARTDRAFDLDGIIEQANRLAEARRGASGDAAAIAMQRTAAELRAAAPDEHTERVESYLRDHAERPRLVEPNHPHATNLGVLVAELQGGGPAAPPSMPTRPRSGLALGVMDEPGAPAETAAGDGASAPAVIAPATPAPPASTPPTSGTEGDSQAGPPPVPQPVPTVAPVAAAPSPATLPSPAPASGERHRLATQLDRLRADVFELFEDAVGRERAVAHEGHILADVGIPSPVSAQDTVRYLRSLLCDEPPKRWHFFKRSRTKMYAEVTSKLLAFHAANSHVDDPIVHEVTKLWTRLHK
ncbi:MAG: hypothetical protein CMJ44_00705 [Pimelobacter sp.]|nr:hypothetical protein [Pimelobacter sp.]